MTAEDFARAFATAFAARDADSFAALLAPDATCLSLTGAWAEAPVQAQQDFSDEAAGIFARARLVTGKGTVQPLGPDHALLRQRYMVSGALDPTGAELARFAAMLIVVLTRVGDVWLAQSLSFSATT